MFHLQRVQCPHCSTYQTLDAGGNAATCSTCGQPLSRPAEEPLTVVPAAPLAQAVSARPLPAPTPVAPTYVEPESALVARGALPPRQGRKRGRKVEKPSGWLFRPGFLLPVGLVLAAWGLVVLVGPFINSAALFDMLVGFSLAVIVGSVGWFVVRAIMAGRPWFAWWGGVVGQMGRLAWHEPERFAAPLALLVLGLALLVPALPLHNLVNPAASNGAAAQRDGR
jgi:hypothetical protein